MGGGFEKYPKTAKKRYYVNLRVGYGVLVVGVVGLWGR